jgi:hypothetical protein
LPVKRKPLNDATQQSYHDHTPYEVKRRACEDVAAYETSNQPNCTRHGVPDDVPT